ncbi:hypothetical protein OCI51_26480 (plasmid) [Lysinibacillus capsici]|uniref:hypothetical protein n=1 Tax=Lysinibacillus capsici TaxID=2115968 RepID=UPI0021DAE8AC|nr:hypothetical protein [Lysinibacillus capsici]UYB50157.1 hypothetical protein OCI51_26865 [Lysinibacillus capsici]UYB50232.1 hypothetical protein OCI51_26480 [Lysinibacillus capsici]
MEKYVILMHDGRHVVTTGVNLKNVAAVYNQRQSIAAVIGKKSMARGLVAAVAKLEALTKTEERNAMIQVGSTLLYTSGKSEKFLETLTNDINNKEFSIVNDEILISRSFYSHAEIDENLNTENEAETQA